MGASVAGPTAAYWFAKAGASVTVIERFPKMRTGGLNIDIRTAGVTVMRKIPGMEAAVRAKITPLEGLSFVRDNGRRMGSSELLAIPISNRSSQSTRSSPATWHRFSSTLPRTTKTSNMFLASKSSRCSKTTRPMGQSRSSSPTTHRLRNTILSLPVMARPQGLEP